MKTTKQIKYEPTRKSYTIHNFRIEIVKPIEKEYKKKLLIDKLITDDVNRNEYQEHYIMILHSGFSGYDNQTIKQLEDELRARKEIEDTIN